MPVIAPIRGRPNHQFTGGYDCQKIKKGATTHAKEKTAADRWEMLRATDKITALYYRLSVEDLKEDKKSWENTILLSYDPPPFTGGLFFRAGKNWRLTERGRDGRIQLQIVTF